MSGQRTYWFGVSGRRGGVSGGRACLGGESVWRAGDRYFHNENIVVRIMTYSATRNGCQLTTFSLFWVYITKCLVYDYYESII